MAPTFTILITTKNRREALAFTLQKIGFLLARPEVECILCDDGSDDGTSGFLLENYPEIRLIRHQKSLGLMASRNDLMAAVRTPFAISIDDDLHFITTDVLEQLTRFFEEHPRAAVASFRIYWSQDEPVTTDTAWQPKPMQGYAGGAHAFRMEAWRGIRPYPEWFRFYGEEDFASFQLFRQGWEVWLLPGILVNHRVNIAQRKRHADYTARLRRSLRAGWYLFFLFYPAKVIPRRLAYSVWMQVRLKVFRGDWRALVALLLAATDLVAHLPRLLRERDALSQEEFRAFNDQASTQLYWTEGT